VRFNRTLIFVLILSVIGEFIFYILTLQFIDEYDASLLTAFGWMFWLGILSFFIPLFVSRKKAFVWFQQKYVWGSFILFALHIIGLIAIGGLTVSIYYNN
jgi:hypothetical protein